MDETNNNGDNSLSFDDTVKTISDSQSSSARESSDGLFVSIHRRNLQRITQDGTQNIRHRVPEMASRTQSATWTSKAALTSYQQTLRNRKRSEWLETLLPMYKWLKIYQWRTSLLHDIIAGCTVGVMVIPQGMSYAKLAGLPVEYGLYSAFVPVYAYAIFGSSRQLAVGPVALLSLLLSTGLSGLLTNIGMAETDDNYQAAYIQLALQTSFLVGIMNLVMGFLRLGFLTIFLSHAVVSGFTTGAAVIIGTSQLKYIFGYNVERSDVLYQILINLFENISEFNYKTFLMGTFSILALVGMKHFGKTFPKYTWVRAIGPLTVTTITVVITVVFDLDQHGIPVVGAIPKGLPSFTANQWTPLDNISQLMKVVISITIVGFMESIAIAKKLASIHKYELDSSLELIGLGMANIMGGMFQGYPVTGSFSRSAVNNESGAQSGISGIVTATIVAFVLLFLTPVFERMPLSVLAAIIISGVLGLLDYDEAMYLWKVHKFDFSVWLVACIGTMFLGVEIGLAIAVGVSILLVTYESAYPHTAVLGRLAGTTVYRNVKQYPHAERYDGIVMVRVDAPIYFANTQSVREKLEKYELAAEKQLAEKDGGSVMFIILELSPVSHVDTSALHILQDMHKIYRGRGIQLCFSNPSVAVMEKFVASGLADEVGQDHIFVTIHDAVTWCLLQMDTLAMSLHDLEENDETDLEGELKVSLVPMYHS